MGNSLLEILVRLEYKRRAIRRSLVMRCSGAHPGLYAIGGVIALALATGLIVPATAAATTPPEVVALSVAVSLGLLLCATVILLPAGLLLL